MGRRQVYRGPRPRNKQQAIDYAAVAQRAGDHRVNGPLFVRMVEVIAKRVFTTEPYATSVEGAAAPRIVLARDEDGSVWFSDVHFTVKVNEELLREVIRSSEIAQKVIHHIPTEPMEVIEYQGGERIREGKEVRFFSLFDQAEKFIKKDDYAQLYPTPYVLYAECNPTYVHENFSMALQYQPIPPNMSTKFEENIFVQLDFVQIIQKDYWELRYFCKKPRRGIKRESLAWAQRAIYIQRDNEIVGVAMPIRVGSADEIHKARYQHLPLEVQDDREEDE